MKEATYKRSHIVSLYSYEISIIGKSIETECRVVVVRGSGKEGIRSDCLMGMEFPFGVLKCFGTRQRWWLHNIVNIVLNATEMFTFKWLIL